MCYNFNKDINYAKIVLGLNDNELSKYLNISRMTLNRWQNNKVVPNYDSLEKIYNKFYSGGINLNRLKEEISTRMRGKMIAMMEATFRK